MSELEERLRALVAGSIDGAELDSLRTLQGGASSLTLLATLRASTVTFATTCALKLRS